jgi:tripartite-type tricarboxylate transporter receptor subunit TctC
MRLSRRQSLHLAAGAAALPAISRVARAQTYPTRPVRIIVPVGPAGASDITARVMGQWLSKRLGQPFVIENRPGVGGNIGTEAAVRAAPDGYTLVIVGQVNAVNSTLYEKLSFNLLRDLAPVAAMIRFPDVMLVNPSVPATTVSEFITYAKANPGGINMASTGIGSSPHVAGELFKMTASVNFVHVPYRSAAAALTDLIGGQVQLMFISTAASIAYVKSGQLRALAVTTADRSDALPNTPAVNEFLPGFEESSWYGIGAPKNTPTEIVDTLNREVNSGLADPMVKARLNDLGGIPMPMTPTDFGKLIAADIEKWGKVIRAANIKVE